MKKNLILWRVKRSNIKGCKKSKTFSWK